MDDDDMVEDQTQNKEIFSEETIRQYVAMADIARTYYLMTPEGARSGSVREIYKGKNWIMEKLGKNWEPKLQRYFSRSMETNFTFKASRLMELASEGNELEALKIVEGERLSNHDFMDSVNFGSVTWFVSQKKPLEALDRASKIRSAYSLMPSLGKVFECVDVSNKDKVFEKIERQIQTFSKKANTGNGLGVDLIIDNVVKSASLVGEVEEAKKILTLVGRFAGQLEVEVDDFDGNVTYPRASAFVNIGKAWARIGDFEKAKSWLRKGGVKNTIDKQIAMSLSDWGTVPANEAILLWAVVEKKGEVEVSDYRWGTESWFESGRTDESMVWWKYVTNNQNFLNLIKTSEIKVGELRYFWKKAKELGDLRAEKLFLEGIKNLFKNDQNYRHNQVQSEIDLDAAREAFLSGNIQERDKNLDLAWKDLEVTRDHLDFHTEEIGMVLGELVNVRDWTKLRKNLDEISKIAHVQNLEKSVSVGLLLLKYKLILFENEYGSYKDQKIDFESWGLEIHEKGWEQASGDSVSVLLESNTDLAELTKSFESDERDLVKIKISSIEKELSIDSEISSDTDIEWVKKQLQEKLGTRGEVKREIIKASLAYITKWEEREGRDFYAGFFKDNQNWWNVENDYLYEDMVSVGNQLLVNINRLSDDKQKELLQIAMRITEQTWASGKDEALKLAALILTKVENREAHEWVVNWITAHTDDFSGADKALTKSRLDFLQAGLSANVEKINFVAFQLMGEEIFDYPQMEDVLEKLVENRFLERSVVDWWHNFTERESDENIRHSVMEQIGFLISQGVYPHREVLEKFFDEKWPGEENKKLTIEEKISLNRESSKHYSESFKQVFSRDANPEFIKKIQESGGVRCVIGSVYGEPVILVQNFESENSPVDGHHEILSSWANGNKIKSSAQDSVVQAFIGKLVNENELPVEHFLRGFLSVEKNGVLILRADAGFQQSSVSSRAELIPKVADTAKLFGIDRLEDIPDNEYGELQRVGFMRGVVKKLTQIIKNNLGENDEYTFQKLAKRFYVDQEFGEMSKSYDQLKFYLDLIEYYRRGGK